MAKTRSSSQVGRREVLSVGAVMTGIGVVSAAVPAAASASDGESGRELAAVGQIYRLQAAFHRAKSTQDIDLMMSLWDSRATLTVLDDPKSPYAGFDQLKAFWQGSGSFTHRRFSLVPSFKIQMDVHATRRRCTLSAMTSATSTWPPARSPRTRSCPARSAVRAGAGCSSG